jgi:hypothetical protein
MFGIGVGLLTEYATGALGGTADRLPAVVWKFARRGTQMCSRPCLLEVCGAEDGGRELQGNKWGHGALGGARDK